MSELEHLFSAAAPSSSIAKKSNVQSSTGPKSEKVQLVIIQFGVPLRLLMDIYII